MGTRISVKNILQKKYRLVDGLSERFIDCFGQIEDTFTALFYGESGEGKTNLTIQVLKELKSLGSMLYVSYEEGHGKTIQDLIIRHNLADELCNLIFSDNETIDDLVKYLKRKQSPKVIVLDTWQYSEFTFEDYKRLKNEFVFGKTAGRRKIIIIISHVKGKTPDGKSALEVKRDANIKVFVSHYLGFVVSRFGSTKNYVVYEDGAKHFYGKDLNKLVNKVAVKKEKIIKKEKPKEVVSKAQILPPETEEEKTEAMLKKLKETK